MSWNFAPCAATWSDLSLGAYFAEVIESLVPEGNPPDELLPLLLNCLYAWTGWAPPPRWSSPPLSCAR